MPVGKKLHTALAMMETLKGNMETFALSTDDPLAQQMYNDFSTQLEQMTTDFKSRIQYVEEQEPQYKMTNMQQKKQDNMQQQ